MCLIVGEVFIHMHAYQFEAIKNNMFYLRNNTWRPYFIVIQIW